MYAMRAKRRFGAVKMIRAVSRKGIIYSAAGAIGWGLSGVCSQYLFTNYGLDSAWLTAVRMLLSGVVLLAASAPSGAANIFGIFRRRTDVLWLLAYAILGLLLCSYSYLAAIEHSNSATATVLQSLNVVMMALLMAVYRRTSLRVRQILALLFAVAGVFLVATHGNFGSMIISGSGLAFGLISAVGVLTYTLLSRPISARWGNAVVTGWGMFIGGTVLTVAQRSWNIPPGLDQTAVALIAVIIFIGTAGSYTIFLQGMKYIGPEKATLIGCLEPATATVLSALWLGSSFGAAEISGFALILLTVFLSSKEDRQERTA